MQVPEATWQLYYGGKNVTGNLIKHAAKVDYHEAVGGKMSTLQISLEDASKVFQNNLPTPGTAVSLAIGYAGGNLISCGDFEVDEWEFQGPPDVFVLRCIQAGITRSFRSPRSAAYENQSLISIATTIANKYGMTVVADAVSPDVIYTRQTQRVESDLAFLHRISNAHNYEFNIRGNQLIFYSRPQLESATVVGTVQKTDTVRFRIQKQHAGNKSYKSAVVTYLNPYSKALLQANAIDTNVTSADTLSMVERLENSQQATIKSQSHLHTANMQQIKGDITVPGTMLYRAGNTLNLNGFGSFDAIKFLVYEARHTISRQAYITNLMIRTIVTGGAKQLISNEYEDR